MPKKFLLTGVQIQGFRAAKRLHGTFLSLGLARLPEKAHAQAAFIVSKKVSPRASVRNLVKRRLKAAALSPMRRMPALMLVFTAKKEAADATFADLRSEAQDLLAKAQMMA